MSLEKFMFSGVEPEKLLPVIQAGLHVRLKHHFFNWTQGPMQTLLPHDLLICGIADRKSPDSRFQSVSFHSQSASLDEAVCGTDGEVVKRMVQAWERNGCDPVLFNPQAAAGPISVLVQEIADCALGSVLMHGTCGMRGSAGTFFGFCRMRDAADPRHAYVAELLVPYLHAAWMRIQHHEGAPVTRRAPMPGVASATRRALTARELEILRLVYEGKSNMTIGMILGISGLTVKNHLRNILRKLNVSNRMQAVIKGLLLNLPDRLDDA